MMNLLMYEWKKFIYNKKNKMVFLIILVSFIGYVSFHFYQNQIYMEKKVEQFYTIRQNIQYDIENMINYQSLVEKPEEKQYYGKKLEYFNKLYNSSNDLYCDYSNSINSLDDIILWNELLIEGKTKKYEINMYTNDSLEKLKKNKKELRYLEQNHIPIKESSYVCSSLNLIVNLAKLNLGFVIGIFYFLLIFDVFSEFDCGTYKILYSTKDNYFKIILSKMIFSFFVLILFVAFIVLLFFFNFFTFGLGNIQYPFSIGTNVYSEIKIVIYIFLIIISMCIFLIGVYALISYLLKSTTTSLVVTITIYLIMNLAGEYFSTFNYLIGFLNIDISCMIQQNKVGLTCLMDIIVLVVCVIFSTLVLQKKDIVVKGD